MVLKKKNKSSVSPDLVLAPYRVPLCNYGPVIEKIKQVLRKKKITATVELGGSVAKGTFLKPYDVDIFVRFKKKVDSEVLAKLLPPLFGKVVRVHGSRDYFQFSHQGHQYEIVPVLHIQKPQEAENITDVSYFHVQWVHQHLKNPDDARLAKLFAHAQGVYGAESYVNGFSGYVLEVLTIHYGGFAELMAAASYWKPQTILDPAQHYKSQKDILLALNAAKTQSPLIVVDPVQKERNAAAALSLEMFSRFVAAARLYVHQPSPRFFVPQKFSSQELKQRVKQYGLNLTLVQFTLLLEKKDIALTKALAAFHQFQKQIVQYDFTLVDSNYERDHDLLWFLTFPHELSKYKKQQGPELWVKEQRLVEFREQHPDAFLEQDRLVALVPRKYRTIKSLFAALVKKDEIRKRIAKIRVKAYL